MKCAWFVLMLVTFKASGQNLISNPSFENLISCPDNFFQIFKARPWFSPDCAPFRPDTHGFAVLFNACNTSFASVPTNSVCTQTARTGVSYAGIEVVSSYNGNYRQYLEQKLNTPLQAGKKYFFSMYINLCNHYSDIPIYPCFISDSTGVAFSSTIIDKNPECRTLPLKPDVYGGLPSITQSEQWHRIEGCYVAKGNEEYLIIGNFGGDEFSNCSQTITLGYFIFIDDVSLFPEIKKTIDTTLCADETWKFDAKNLREEYKSFTGWTYSWSDGDTSSTRTFTKGERLQLTVSRKGCFNDVYNLNIEYNKTCDCAIYVPNGFSPNKDGKNDIFKPSINCQNIAISNYRFSVFNRWGQRVFITTDRMAGWDGSYHGNILSNEIYVWHIEYDVLNGFARERKTVSGTVLSVQ